MSTPRVSICVSKVQVVLLPNLFTDLECKMTKTTRENVKDPRNSIFDSASY